MKDTVTSNDVFGRLTALEEVAAGDWLCQCTCGNKVVVRWYRLLSGNNKSCGCLKRSVLGDHTRRHGRANSRITGYSDRAYGVWQAMKDRCNNPNRKDYHRYGGRGIGVCERWLSFENFLADMGEPPEGKTLDRLDNDKGYSPDNCAWRSRKEQVHNSTRIKHITIGDVTKPLSTWLALYGTSRNQYYSRLRKGYSEIQALQGDAK